MSTTSTTIYVQYSFDSKQENIIIKYCLLLNVKSSLLTRDKHSIPAKLHSKTIKKAQVLKKNNKGYKCSTSILKPQVAWSFTPGYILPSYLKLYLS